MKNAPSSRPCVLTINGGSSSVRFAVHEIDDPAQRRLTGKIERIGTKHATFTAAVGDGPAAPRPLSADSLREAVVSLLTWLEAQPAFASVRAVGHRVVHGMEHFAPERITGRLLAELRRILPYDPEHLPLELELIAAFRARHPSLPQVACFDTAFHRTMPPVAQRLALPRHFARRGMKRYGFHGISCAYLMEELRRLDPRASNGRVVLAHLGNGASLTAVHRGRSVDTSMGFTPAAGLVMGTRSGDLDPGVFSFLARTERLTAARFQQLVNQESGLLGVSGTSSDMRDLLVRAARDPRAAEAVELFCYQARKWLGAFAATLGGLDTLVFAGGIGENGPAIRARMCAGLDFIGIRLDSRRNARNAALISTPASRVKVRVIHTDEELMIARSVIRLLRLAPTQAITS